MLPDDLWRPWEPRAVFPVFGEALNYIEFAVQDSLRPSLRSLARIGHAVVKKHKPLGAAARDAANALFGLGMRFRGAYLTRGGAYLGSWTLSGPLQAGEFFSADVNALAGGAGLPVADGLFVLIASRGRLDRWSTSPGSATARYVGDQYIAGYRTGLFARPLNPVDGKRHFGFTGVNPQVIVREGVESGVLLINHSSDPAYDRPVTPSIRLYRDRDHFLEASFGEIPPHGALERRMSDLFPGAREFLAPSGGRGLTVARVQGASLASIHLLRAGARSLALDHSRPSYTNVVDYL